MLRLVLVNIFLITFSLGQPAERILRFQNDCAETIWVGALGTPLAMENTGFELVEQQGKDIYVDTDMAAARFWARTGCEWKEEPSWAATPWPKRFQCESGDCGAPLNNFGVQCGPISGQPPVSLIEMTLQSFSSDFYDLSNVDGYQIPYSVEVWGPYLREVDNPDLGHFNCGNATCSMNTEHCPEELQKVSASGNIYCMSICSAVNDVQQVEKFPILQEIILNGQKDLVCCNCACGPECGCSNPDSRFCCSPYGDQPDGYGGTCDLEKMPKVRGGEFQGFDYEQVFKQQCPNAYSWQFDDFDSTYQCVTPYYKITFCAED